MSTDQLLGAVLKASPQSDPSVILEMIVACNGDIDQVFNLMGIKPVSRQRQMTFDEVIKAHPPDHTVAQPPLPGIVHLFTADQVANAPIMCTMIENVLEPSLANSLLCDLMEKSHDWSKQEFYLFDRQVTSPHLSASYTCNEQVLENQDSTYQGRTVRSREFTPEMHAARRKIEEVIAEKFPGLGWYSDLIVTNRYDGKDASVGYHSDQLTHLGPKPIIVGLSLGSNREFRLKERSAKKKPTQYSIHTTHNSIVIMNPGCQEAWKHSIPPLPAVGSHALSGTTRISLTFRMYPPEYTTENLPKCKCHKPMILRTTTSKPYKYIWQCSQEYATNKTCGMTMQAKLN